MFDVIYLPFSLSLGSIIFSRNERVEVKAWQEFGSASSSIEFAVHDDHFFPRRYNRIKSTEKVWSIGVKM